MIYLELLRFGIVGVTNTLIDFAVYNLLTSAALGLRRIPANLVSTSAAMTFSFLANWHWVFAPENAVWWQRAVPFVLVSMTSAYLVQSTIIAVTTYGWIAPVRVGCRMAEAIAATDYLTPEQIQRNLVKIFAVIGGAIWNFLWYKYVVFQST